MLGKVSAGIFDFDESKNAKCSIISIRVSKDMGRGSK